jgi:hypothetical protein
MTKNIATAAKALDAELEAGRVEHDDVAAYLESVDAIIDQMRAIKGLYKNEIAAEASRRSRAKKAAELEAMKARLAELESKSK